MLLKQRIIVVSELFYPEESATGYILSKVAEELAREFEVLVLAGPSPLAQKEYFESVDAPIDDSRILRVWAPQWSKNHLLGRVARGLILSLGLAWKALVSSRSTDFIMAVTNPPTLLVVLAIVRKLRQNRLVFLIHDVFPENALATGVIRRRGFVYAAMKRIFDWAYASADALITIGRDMSEVVARKGAVSADRITLIENWADHPLINRIPRSSSGIHAMGLTNCVVIQYAGNIGRAQGLLEFVGLISGVQNSAVRYVFRGEGALLPLLREATVDHGRFIFRGGYSRAEQSDVLGACDIALVILGPGMYGLGVPSKTYNILAAGKPILFLGPRASEVYRIIKDHNIGWAFDWSEGDQLAALIDGLSMRDLSAIEELGVNARRLAERHYTKSIQLGKFSALFERLASSDD